MLIELFKVAGGIFFLFFGAELMLKSASHLAKSLGIPPIIIGLTIIAFGTSAPELFVSVKATLSGHPDIAVGNVVGSNLANILLLLGAVGLFGSIPYTSDNHVRDGVALMVSTIVIVVASVTGAWTWEAGIIALPLLVLYLLWCYRGGTLAKEDEPLEIDELNWITKRKRLAFVGMIGGIAITVLGSEILVDGGSTLARHIGVSEAAIGLTLIAIGTCLPELATLIVGAIHKDTHVAIGNIIGSNIFNSLGVMGVVGLFKRTPVPDEIMDFDIWLMLAITVFFTAMILMRNKMGRKTAFAFLGLYALYVVQSFMDGNEA